MGPDNSIYVTSGRHIRRIGPDGIITNVAGSVALCDSGDPSCGDGGPAILAMLASPRGIAVGRDGSIYIADLGHVRVRRVTPDGIIRTIAGTGDTGFSGDGGPATQARFSEVMGVAVGPDDSVYVAERGNSRIRWFRPGGIIDTLAGNGVATTTGDGGLAVRASLDNLDLGIAVGPDGGIYFAQTNVGPRIRRIAPIGERFVGGELVVPAAGGGEVYIFTLDGRHLRTLDALTGTLRHQFAYDGAGRLDSVTDGDGNVTTIERDGKGRPIAIVGPFGQVTELEVDGHGFLSRVTNPAGEAVELVHDGGGRLTGVTRPGGQASSYQYDDLGRLMAATDPTGARKTLRRTGTSRDYTVTMTSSLGRASTFFVSQSASGSVHITTVNAAGAQAHLVTGLDGHQSATMADGTTMSLDLAADPRWGMRAPIPASLTVTTPGGLTHTTTTQRVVTLVSPADLLNLKTLTDSTTINGRLSTSTYDGPSRILTHNMPSGRRMTVAFDSRGRPVEVQDGNLESMTSTYDPRGRPATISWGQGASSRITDFSYGPDGFLASVTDPLDRTVAFSRDAAGRVTRETLPGGQVLGLGYDVNGNLSTFTPPGESSHTFAYTPRDEVKSYNPPNLGQLGTEARFTYNADRQPKRIDRPDGQATTFQFDSAGRLGLIDHPTGKTTCAYDAANRLITLATSQGISLGTTHDDSLLTGTIWSGAVPGSVTRTYDTDFRVSTLRVNGANPIAIQYDADGLMIEAGSLDLTRDAQTGLVTATTLGALGDAMTYDGFGDLATYTASHGASGVYSVAYSRDKLGRITTKSETIEGATRVSTYTYDLDGRLTEVRQDNVLIATYTYDADGNRLSFTGPGGTVTAGYDAQERLSQQGAAAYAYTPSGELLRKTAAGQITTYEYDGLGNLKGVTLPSGTRIDYLLDGRGRRVGKKANGTLVQGFLYQDGLRPIAELDGVGAVVSRFIYGSGSNVPDYLVKGGATIRIIVDHLGSPRLVIDVATGQVLQRMDHDEFGRVVLDSNPGFQPFGFAGGLYEPLTGLVHFGAREYDPQTGRWTVKDPGGFSGGPNLYVYADDDPVNLIDPFGDNPNREAEKRAAVQRMLDARRERQQRVQQKTGVPQRPVGPRVSSPKVSQQDLHNAVCPTEDAPRGRNPQGGFIEQGMMRGLAYAIPGLGWFLRGFEFGQELDREYNISGQSANLGEKAADWASDLGLPDVTAESLGLVITLGSSGTGSVAIIGSWIWD